MLTASAEFHRTVADNSKVVLSATVTFADGTTRQLTGADFMMGGAQVTKSVSSLSEFEIGAAVASEMQVDLYNGDGRFDAADFDGATVQLRAGVELSDGTVETVDLGKYWVEQPDAYSSTLTLTGLDAISRLDRPYSLAATAYPATLGQIVSGACQACGLTLLTNTFPNYTYRVTAKPDDSALTCRDVVSFAAQIAGCYVRCDKNGRVSLGWYDTSVWETEGEGLDGGEFDASSPYATGDAADGGAFMSGGVSEDGGSFPTTSGWFVLTAHSSLSLMFDDVVVTGVRVTASDGADNQKGETYLAGTEGYVLDVSGNPLIERGKASTVAAQLQQRVGGMRFRPFEEQGIGDPCREPGDGCLVVDAKGHLYRSYVTSVTWKAGGFASHSCGAEAPARNSATRYSAATKAMVAARRYVEVETTARQAAVSSLQTQLDNAGGLYMTREQQADQSYIYYMHDKPLLADSGIVWKMTADALGISMDGGTTYPYGLDATGQAILSRVYAIGIDADYINTGRIADRLGYNYLDLDTGEMHISSSATIAGVPAYYMADDNILPFTANMDATHGWTQINGVLSGESSGIIQANTSGTLDWAHRIASPEFSLSAVWDKEFTFSFDGLCAGGAGTVRVELSVYRRGSINRFAYRSLGDVTLGPATERKSITATVGASTNWGFADQNDTSFEATDAARIIIYSRVLNRQVHVGKWKLQLASEATLWSPAKSDLVALASLGTLTQEDVFNRLTNDGALQGLYMSGGKLYVNASYIKTGQLTADLITSGKLTSANGFTYFDLDNNLIRLATSATDGVTIDSTGQIRGVNSSSEYFGTVSAGANASGTMGQMHYLTWGNYVYAAIVAQNTVDGGGTGGRVDIRILKYANRKTVTAFYALTAAQKWSLFNTDSNLAVKFILDQSKIRYSNYVTSDTMTFSQGAVSVSCPSWIWTITTADGPVFTRR